MRRRDVLAWFGVWVAVLALVLLNFGCAECSYIVRGHTCVEDNTENWESNRENLEYSLDFFEENFCDYTHPGWCESSIVRNTYRHIVIVLQEEGITHGGALATGLFTPRWISEVRVVTGLYSHWCLNSLFHELAHAVEWYRYGDVDYHEDPETNKFRHVWRAVDKVKMQCLRDSESGERKHES